MPQTLSIILNNKSVDALKNTNSALYAFQAVRFGQPRLFGWAATSFGGGYPLVWFKTDSYLPNTNLVWSLDIKAFIAPMEENAVVSMGSSVETAVGKIVTVSDTGGLSGKPNGTAGVVSIHSEGGQAWCSGLAMSVNQNKATAICAFPLYSKQQIMIAPTSKVLVMFATDVSEVGTVVKTAWNDGLLVDFDSQDSRNVSFDIDSGWSVGDAVWAKQIYANDDLGALLIIPSNQ